MLIDLRKQSVCRDLEKALCEDMLKDFKPKFIILKQERPKITKQRNYLVNDKIYEGLNSTRHFCSTYGSLSRSHLAALADVLVLIRNLKNSPQKF